MWIKSTRIQVSVCMWSILHRASIRSRYIIETYGCPVGYRVRVGVGCGSFDVAKSGILGAFRLLVR
jgi:hypothetical protein